MVVRAFLIAVALLLPLKASAQFQHPGILVDSGELAFARDRIAGGVQPWTDAIDYMVSHQHASLSYQPNARANVHQDSYGSNDSGGWIMMTDARAAYLHALIWAVTGNQAHADVSKAIVNDWSGSLTSVTGVNAKLIGAAAFAGFANAAELLAHTDTGWSAEDRAQCETFFREVCYPLIQDFQPGYNGNWDAIITNAMMAMGVFLDDQAMFDRAVNYFMHGHGNGSLPNYVREDGTTQETYRDPEHENMGISGLTASAQIAMHQGLDLYGYLDNRLLAGAEGVAGRVLDAGIRQGPCWEMLYTHYHGRLGLPMPNTERIFSQTWFQPRPEDYGLMQGIGYGTLTSYYVSVPATPRSVGAFKGRYRR
jgi:hypothetical protein